MAYVYIGNQKVSPIIIRDYKVVTVSGATPSITLDNYTVYNAGTLTSLTINAPSSNIPTDYLVQIDFTSGSTPTVINDNNSIDWAGDNVNEEIGFIPRSNCKYTLIIFYSNGGLVGNIQGISIS